MKGHNLLDNAVRYSPNGGPIDVSIRREGSDAIVRVTDRGVGVPEEEQAHLFQRFFRTIADARARRDRARLFISRRIAEAHGGRLWLERSDPGGTTFALSLPVVRAGS